MLAYFLLESIYAFTRFINATFSDHANVLALLAKSFQTVLLVVATDQLRSHKRPAKLIANTLP